MLWRRLDGSGHDAAILVSGASGWILQGTAVFAHEAGGACLSYRVDLDGEWRSRAGAIEGFVGTRTISHAIAREANGWSLNGKIVDGIGHLLDLDYSFTPATNFQQLQRIGIGAGAAAEIPAAWFNLEDESLTELPQRYERQSDRQYAYKAPSLAFETDLVIAPNGFVSLYPPYWEGA
ncbi:putative glycolipid-binding domain-containing protein [Sphingosinicella sp. GR2756]|uniref:Glycolipid-binding domain-containing protein n=2 Tax=Sphingosinicella rhizophila TaxID=3050082 RepID=A0ABU3QB08_9SPHN|nr:putative glycolipid-binding domain-containing protein [Sphingosinicella sp. GR2756]